MPRYYMRVEAVNLDHFVYDTQDISTIRGGSFILLDAIEKLADTPELGLEIISKAASQGIFSFDCENDGCALERRKLVLQHLSDQTGGHATFAAAVEQDLPRKFRVVLQRLEAEVRRQQLRRPTVAIPEADQVRDECFLDGWRPGVVPYRVDPNVADRRISRSTHFRREEGRELRHKLFARLLGDPSLSDNLCARDLEALSAHPGKGVLNGKMALIYADGNSFGAIRGRTIETPKMRKEFDQAIQDEVRIPFLRELVKRAQGDADFGAQDTEGKPALRIEVLLWGGDEFMLVVPAWRGWQTLELFYEHAKGASFEGTDLTHRAVILFCHHNAPILQLRELAGELLRQTKDDLKNTYGSELDKQGLDEDERDQRFSELSCHAWGDGLHYLNLESFEMLRGSLEGFLSGYYRGVPYHELLIHAHELSIVRDNLKVLQDNLTRSRVIEIVRALQNPDSAQTSASEGEATAQLRSVDTIIKRAYSLLPKRAREETRRAIEDFIGQRSSRWYLVNDLWDYVPEWRPQ